MIEYYKFIHQTADNIIYWILWCMVFKIYILKEKTLTRQGFRFGIFLGMIHEYSQTSLSSIMFIDFYTSCIIQICSWLQ